MGKFNNLKIIINKNKFFFFKKTLKKNFSKKLILDLGMRPSTWAMISWFWGGEGE
jgi:hypothetical protein